MIPRALPFVVLAAALAGCESSVTYTAGDGPAPAAPVGSMLARRLTVQSRPRGAMISVNGTSVGEAPVQVEIKIDEAGRLLDSIDLAADYAISNPVRGALNVVTITLKRGEIPPRELLLARAADGGIQRTGTVPP